MTAQAMERELAALGAALPQYRPRAGQAAMAQAVAQALACGGTLAVEAGTGIGKTFGYLLPALRHPGRSLICTGTRHLQDQLYGKDLPQALRALGLTRPVCLLKGRANYLCLHRYQALLADDLGLGAGRTAELARVRDWAGRTATGDLAELRLPEEHPLVPSITSTVDNCLGQKCPEHERCHVVRARERALRAELVVTNHHLFAADLMLREEKLGRLLPGFDAQVFDEAHRLAEVLESAFEEGWSMAAALRLAQDVRAHAARARAGALEAPCRALAEACRALHADLRAEQPAAPAAEQLEPPAEFAARAQPVLAALAALADALGADDDEPERASLRARAQRQHAALAGWPGDDPNWVAYLRLSSDRFRLHRLPIDISQQFAGARARYGPCWIFTSATLGPAAADGGTDFSYFRSRLGLAADARTLSLPSPYDYPRQARLYLPPSLPEPNSQGYTAALLEDVLPLLQALQGRTLMLFTSLRAMREAGDWLRAQPELKVLVQGEESKTRLLRRFGAQARTVLLGSISFWEGVDVPGPALRCVVIDKIPFHSHRERLAQARIAAVERDGGNAFRQLQLPRAALLLKQGAGRLIRSETDRGVVVLGDPRARTRNYGAALLRGLPPMPQERDRAAVLEFLRA